MINAWVVIGPSMMNAYRARRAAEDAGQDYSGPMDDTTWQILNDMSDIETVQAFYRTKTVNGNNPFTLFTMNFQSEDEAVEAIDYLDANWPGKQIEVQGVWHFDGRQVTGIDELPRYPIPSDAYQLMPPVIVYDENGDIVSETPPASNADLRDINLLSGQSPRDFNPSGIP